MATICNESSNMKDKSPMKQVINTLNQTTCRSFQLNNISILFTFNYLHIIFTHPSSSFCTKLHRQMNESNDNVMFTDESSNVKHESSMKQVINTLNQSRSFQFNNYI